MTRFLRKPEKLRLPLLACIPLLALVTACEKERQPDSPAAAPQNGTAQPKPTETSSIVTLDTLDRADLVAAAAAAADAVAAGRPLPRSSLSFANRTFELRLPFGCGPATSSDWWEWSMVPETQVLRIAVKPQRWIDDPRIRALAEGTSFEAVEGFWIEQPWTSSEDCPRQPTLPPEKPSRDIEAKIPVAAAPPTLAIAQFYGPGAPRSSQRGNRPYTYTGKLGPDAPPVTAGFRLRLTGRITGFADGQPIHCGIVDASSPPLCVIAVQFTAVGFELPGTRETLANWKY